MRMLKKTSACFSVSITRELNVHVLHLAKTYAIYNYDFQAYISFH